MRKKLTARIKKSSWQTTLAGIIGLAATGAQVYGMVTANPVVAAIPWQDVAQTAGQAIIAGGLIAARDAGK